MIALLLACSQTAPSILQLDGWAQLRDVAHLSAAVRGLPVSQNPLEVLRTNGAYQAGKFGWRAFEMKVPGTGEDFVVLSTPLTSEDTGEFLFRRTGAALTYLAEQDSLGVHIVRHSLDVQFLPQSKSAQIRDRLTLEPTGAGAFVFRMSPEFRVQGIRDDKGNSLSFAQAGGIVAMTKPATFSTTLDISYGGVVDRPLYSGSISSTEATLTNCYWYPMIARQPAPYQVTAHCPASWTVVGQGVKTAESPGEATFRMDLPCIFYSLSAGPYKTATYPVGDRTYYGWSPRLGIESLRTQAETYPEIIKFYEQFAPFPFKSYGALDSPHYGGGALEAYSYATYGGGFPYMDPHEPSHTWWGGMLNNTYLRSFWNESFAVYSENLFRRSWSGSPANVLAFTPQGEVDAAYDQFACAACGAACGPAASALGYGKGSHVLFMLEKLIGKEALLRSMRRFILDQPPEKPTEWEDFERAAEKENPELRLESFFADWLDQPGHIEFSAAITYREGQVLIDFKPLNSPRRIPLEVLVEKKDGSRQLKVFDVREAQILKIPLEMPPRLVSVDPYRYLVRRQAVDETPVSIASVKAQLKVYVDPAHPEWSSEFGPSTGAEPRSLEGSFFVGGPKSSSTIAALLTRAGFVVKNNALTFRDRTIDLDHGAAEAVFDLGGGKYCGVGIGRTRIPIDPGSASVAVFDDLGRMLDGEVLPKTMGSLTQRF